MRILLTGATGFVGQRLVDYLLKQTDAELRLAVRTKPVCSYNQRVSLEMIPNISAETNWDEALSGCDVVIHLAARVHVMEDNAQNPLEVFRATNTDGTLNLARQAISAGVKRFIFISTIKVNGESTAPGQSFGVNDLAMLACPYAISKYEAEQGLLALAAKNDMEVVILRPVLIYGPGVKGNFQQMIEWLQKGVPLPLGRVNNKRSFLSVDNLIDLITTCMTHPRAANQVFLVSDDHDLSTTELLQKLSRHLNKRVLLLPVPSWLLRWAANMIGKTSIVERLYGSLQVDISKTRDLLGWQPVINIDEALCSTVEEFL